MARYIDADNLIDELSAACMPIYEKGITGILGDNSSIADSYYGLFIEMKRTSGGRVSESQQKFLKTLNDNGYLAVVCKGFEQAQEAILKYLNKGVRK